MIIKDKIPKGLKLIHIGEDVWKIGKQKLIDGKLHQVIYGPDAHEYHLWGDEVKQFYGENFREDNNLYNRDNNYADQARVKVYILTSILDEDVNWCFDLSIIPDNGRLKVIYDNGTVKDVYFNGSFVNNIIKGVKKIKPVGYRIK